MHQELQKALTTLEEDIKEIHTTGDVRSTLEVVRSKPDLQNTTDEDLEVIREKIKAARLEKLMARQLASELGKPTDTLELQAISKTSLEESNTNKEEDADTIVTNRDLIKTIDDTSNTLNEYIAEMNISNQPVSDDATMEALGIIENQNKQIELLEFLRQKEADQTHKLNEAMKQLEKLAQSQHVAIEESRNELNNILKKNLELNEKIKAEKSENSRLKEAFASVEKNTQSQQEELVKIYTEYEALQQKHAKTHTRNMEQQSQNHERINVLETQLRSLNAEVKTLRKEKTDMFKEAEANNKLIILQDEMITALSMDKSETLKI